MAYRKTAIALPGDLLEEVNAAAGKQGWSRSRFIVEILRRAMRARRDAEITRRIDEVFAVRSTREEQRRETLELASAAVDWDDERW